MQSHAIISEDGKYRYTLIRQWSDRPMMVWCMLNPSTADASQDDPTIRRCIAFAVREGYGGIHVVNLMAFRATDPGRCLVEPDPCGPHNDEHLRCAARKSEWIVAAWGAKAPRHVVESAVSNFEGRALCCLGITRDGSPRHPLYVASAQPFVEWKAPA